MNDLTPLITPGVDCHRTTYSQADCKVGVVHLGFGAFHRAHQAVYIDDYMQATGDLKWGIAAVNLRAAETGAFQESQRVEDGYLLKTTSPAGERRFRRVRSHVAFCDWADEAQNAQAIALLALPSVSVVSITVTESGYYLNDDWSLNTADPVIAAEIAGETPTSVYGYLAQALAHRAANLDAPLTILCCDNIRSNGKMLASNLSTYLQVVGQGELAAWVDQNCTFPCSMVDRITPRATAVLLGEVAAYFPGQSLAPIHAEDFSQWVIADNFAGPMPDLSQVAVQIVPDVDPYEEAKIRILNGGHTALAYLGALAGYETFDQAMFDPVLREHFDRYERKEVLVGLNMSLPMDKLAYLGEIADRFCNPAIADSLERICMDGYSKMPIYVRPTLESCLEQGIVPEAGFGSVASWIIYARRFSQGKMPVAYHEPYWDLLEPLVQPGREEDLANESQLWADLPDRFPAFVPGLVAAIKEAENKWPV